MAGKDLPLTLLTIQLYGRCLSCWCATVSSTNTSSIVIIFTSTRYTVLCIMLSWKWHKCGAHFSPFLINCVIFVPLYNYSNNAITLYRQQRQFLPSRQPGVSVHCALLTWTICDNRQTSISATKHGYTPLPPCQVAVYTDVCADSCCYELIHKSK